MAVTSQPYANNPPLTNVPMTEPLTSDPPPIFHCRQLCFTYPDTTTALHNIDLAIGQRDRIALVGHNGSGKSTLIRHFNGILPVQKGELLYHGTPLTGDHLAAIRLKVGVLFQDPDNHLFCNSLYEDVAFGPLNQGKNREEVDHLVRTNLAKVGLEQYLFKPAHLLSYGQKKRAAFATVMAMEPEMLILDEPTANLDPRQEHIFKQLLTAFTGTLIIIDHDLLFLYEICTRAVVLTEGRIHHDFSMDELVSHPQNLHDHGLDFMFRFTCCGTHKDTPYHHHHHHTHDHNSQNSHLPAPSLPNPPLLELQHYTFAYPDNSPGISDINLCITKGETLALVGENGAGKSTLAHCLMGLHQGKGYLLFQDSPLLKSAHRILRQHIGMVFQHSSDQLFCPSCWQEVAFGPQQMKLSGLEIKQRVHEALAAMQLEGYDDRVPLHMSGGERKRLAIAAVLAMQPAILILDEPTPNLDPQSELLLMELLKQLPITTILITHDLFFIRNLTRRTVVMHQGRIVRDYATTDFLTDDHLQAVNGLDYTYKNGCIQTIQELQDKNLTVAQ